MKLKLLSILLVCIGLLQSLGHITGNKTIKNLGLITVASPLPIVFTQQKGFLETFALDFTLVYEKKNKEERIKITPELYAQLDKPYNYRNVLGAAISYGPILPKELVASVLDYAFITPGVLSETFNLGEIRNASLELHSKTKNEDKTYILPIGEDNER
ncbi:hypothetical protein MN086_03425 [Sulfurovum sp. XGS-02]|uniref:hypothetical protein n=1 Tax=Sulfurovum sp. XGS-02 TaxID=2925411 RepID=UPI00206F321C|nr:hypothetical protein [Sulfurovum sp. XGS-02]UPT78203.1 hypothetical protein MN086_03425 [Sulfurovum sp. XGS-02]